MLPGSSDCHVTLKLRMACQLQTKSYFKKSFYINIKITICIFYDKAIFCSAVISITPNIFENKYLFSPNIYKFMLGYYRY